MYAKIFTQIFDSSIADNWRHRHVFEDLLKLADQNGVVDMTPEAIAARTRMPLTMVLDGITFLCLPDPRSRTKDDDGRRLVAIDPERGWGWLIVNYTKYRNTRNTFDKTAYQREYMKKRRKNPNETPMLDKPLDSVRLHSNKVRLSPSASACTSVPDPGGTGGNGVEPCGFDLAVSPAFTAIKDKLCSMFGRQPGQELSYDDQCQLLTVSARPRATEELEMIIAFRSRAERFPESLSGLLKGWDTTVDRARNWKPKRDTNRPAYFEDNTIAAEMAAMRRRIAKIK